jgi:hypothetical protein
MSLEAAVKEFVDPHGILTWVKNVEVVSSGRVYRLDARNAKTKERMFLQQCVKVCYDYCLPVGYDSFAPNGYEYTEGFAIIYLTPKQWTWMLLR